MMPVAKAKKLNSFSIESLVGRTSPEPTDRSPTPEPAKEPCDRVGFRRVIPTTTTKGVYPNDFYMPFPVDALRGGISTQLVPHPNRGALPYGLPPFHGQPGFTPHQIHPMLMGHGREVHVPFYPWLIPRHGGYYNHRYTG